MDFAAVGQRLPYALKRYAPDNRAVVWKRFPTRSVGVEVGVWKGDFSARLLDRVHPTKFHLVDPWSFEPSDEYADALYGGGVGGGQSDMDSIHDAVRGRFSRQIAAGVVEVHRSTSVDFAETLPDDSIDWLYIDGNHLHDFVLADLRSFFPKVRAGGVVACDDYGQVGWWKNGVTTAVNEFIRTATVQVEAVAHYQFVFTKLG